VAGIRTTDWPAETRHVRDMWDAAENEGIFEKAQLVPGALIVTDSTYTLSAGRRRLPGHIGIITDMNADEVEYIHANPRSRLVETRCSAIPARTIGALSLAGY
jgi:hypothetical protein